MKDCKKQETQFGSIVYNVDLFNNNFWQNNKQVKAHIEATITNVLYVLCGNTANFHLTSCIDLKLPTL